MGCRHNGTREERDALSAFVKLQRAAETVEALTGRHLQQAGVSPSQFGVLEALFHLGPLCQRDLGAKLLKSTGNITLVIDNLEKRGLVRRERDQNDRRYITVHLTDDGRELIARLFPIHAEHVRLVMARLTDTEQAELGRLCRKLGRGE